MNAPLYNTRILRLAASIANQARLPAPMASVEKRSAICGSRVTVDVMTDAAGRVAELGLEVRACALGQASAALMAAHATGKSPDELADARDALTAWLAGAGEPLDWPEIDLFEAALPYPGRHPSIRLAFEAVAEAAAQADLARGRAA